MSANVLEELSKFIFTSKYARYDEVEKRRETWEETAERVRDMHLKKFKGKLGEEDYKDIFEAFELVKQKLVVPSMRSLQFGGRAVEAHNSRIFNCAVRHIDSIRSFSEVFYLLLCGCGVGIGLLPNFLDRLPDLVNEDDKTGTVLTYQVEDTIEGWGDSVQALLNCYFKNTGYSGRKIVFDYSKIRRKGSKLKTGGGKAPGYRGLKSAHIKIKKLLDFIIEENKQNRLKSINAYDILMHCADAVLSGGIRRAATSVVFDKGDEDMLNAKIGNWFEENPQRARSNNSVILLRKKTTLEEFRAIVQRTREFGEPGFVFAEHEWTNFNPCFEIGFIPVTEDGVCGVQFCNLTSMNGRLLVDKESFKKAVWAATLIGTLQATYTSFPYLGRTAEKLTEEEALLGVSITGMMENPDVILNAENQREMAEYAKEVNKIWAKKLEINPAARVTCIKPEGTSSLVLGTSSGIHPHHARKYIRRVQCNKIDSVYQHFAKSNPHLIEESVWSANKTDDVVSFPLTITDKAILKEDIDAIKHLEIIKSSQQNWVLVGTNSTKKKVHHNVSCTVVVNDDRWEEVISYLYDNREYFCAVSLLPASGDKDYKQAPMEKILPEDEERFAKFLENFKVVDYSELKETDDATKHSEELACAGGSCEIIRL
jgi:ribonucleoside-triphosphate reductase (thioredoxin)